MNYLEAGLVVGFEIPWILWLNEEEIGLNCIKVEINGAQCRQCAVKAHLYVLLLAFPLILVCLLFIINKLYLVTYDLCWVNHENIYNCF